MNNIEVKAVNLAEKYPHVYASMSARLNNADDFSNLHQLADVAVNRQNLLTNEVDMANPEDKDDFLPISSKKAAKRTSELSHTGAKKKASSDQVNNTNRFAELSLDFEVLTDKSTSDKFASTVNLSDGNSATDRPDTRSSSPKIKTATFCPPIFIEKINIKSLIEQFQRLPDTEFKVKNMSAGRCKLFVKDPFLHAKLMNSFKEKNISSYSFTPTQLRQSNVILRGLHHGMSPEEIQVELNKQIPNVVDSVKSFATKYSRDHNISTGLFLVTLKVNCSIRDVAKVKQIAYQVVSWERPHSTSKIIQCKRCQKWGHIARNCNRPYTCVKCDQKHEPGCCQLSKDENTAAFCINCGQWGHPANYSGCEAYSAYKKLREGKSGRGATSRNGIGEYGNSRISENRTFASLFNSKTPVPNRSDSYKNNNLFKNFFAVAQQILKPETPSLEDLIINFLKNVNNMSKEERRNQCLYLLEQVRDQLNV